MNKQCACGNTIPFVWSLCPACLDVYGTIRAEWPEWLRFLVNDLNRESKANARHDEIAYNDEFDYANLRVTVDGQHYTRKDGWGPYSDS